MRFVGLIAAAISVFVSGAAYAQDWDTYVNREDFFSLNLPGDAVRTDAPYTTGKGTKLTAHVYTAEAPATDILAGSYSLTVVDYTNDKAEIGTAIDEAVANMRKKGKVTYDGVNMLDNHRSWRMTIETANQHRLLIEILVAANDRLYISQADTPFTSASPAQFQASLQILDANGVRIRNRQVEAVTADEVVPVTSKAREEEVARMIPLVKGTWKAPGGSCEAAYFKTEGGETKTVRGEPAMNATVNFMGQTVKGQIIIQGPREGQFVNTTNDMVVFLFDTKAGPKLAFAAMGPPVIGWPEMTVELCPGSQQG
jgi:hypothetical protein